MLTLDQTENLISEKGKTAAITVFFTDGSEADRSFDDADSFENFILAQSKANKIFDCAMA